MEFLARIYDRLFPRYKCFLVLGSSRGKMAWYWSEWKPIYEAVSEFAQRLGAKPSIHSRQIDRKSAGVRLGRLTWSENGHQRWCHHSPLTESKCDEWIFVDAQIFIPQRSTLLERGAFPFPTAYIQLSPEVTIDGSRRSYDQRLLLCVKSDRYGGVSESVQTLLRTIQQQVNAILNLSEVRRVVSLNQFESIVGEDFLYFEAYLDPLPDLSKMRGRWVVEAEHMRS